MPELIHLVGFIFITLHNTHYLWIMCLTKSVHNASKLKDNSIHTYFYWIIFDFQLVLMTENTDVSHGKVVQLLFD